MREYGEALSPPSGPPDQLMHLMINLDDGPCYEFLCQKFHYDQVPTDPERWKMSCVGCSSLTVNEPGAAKSSQANHWWAC